MTSASHVPPTLIDVPPLAPAGVGSLDIYLDGQPVGDVEVQTCARCRRGIIHHVRVDPAHRRSGLARMAVTTILQRYADYTWSTPAIPNNPAARGFWDTIGIPTGTPITCRHMRDADGPDTPRRSVVASWAGPRR